MFTIDRTQRRIAVSPSDPRRPSMAMLRRTPARAEGVGCAGAESAFAGSDRFSNPTNISPTTGTERLRVDVGGGEDNGTLKGWVLPCLTARGRLPHC
ncbi:MAG: hypothetical protein AAF645_22025, partial [Myxococcota bacterium]